MEHTIMEEQIKKLIFSNEFLELSRLEKTTNVFKIIGVHQNENIHSNIIASLLDNNKSVINSRNFLQDIIGSLAIRYRSFGINEISEILSCDFKVYREKYRIDILLEDWNRKIVIGIENKINAIERESQISDYQNILLNNYSGFKSFMIFLTPKGYSSETVDLKNKIPCYSLSYEDIYNALKHQESNDNTNLIKWLCINLEKEIIMNSEEKEMVRKLWSNYDTATILRTIYDNRPKMEDIKQGLIKRIKDITKKEIILSKYPEKRGDLIEIKVGIKEWSNMGYPFTFMFYMYETNPAFRVLIHSSKLNREKMSKFHEYSNADFDRNLPTLPNWNCWHKVFVEGDYPEESYLNDFGFNQNTIDEFIRRFEIAYKKINVIIESLSE